MAEPIVICLVGLTGQGKSETGNMLCGEVAFKAASGFSSETRECAWKDYELRGSRFRVIDTPGLHDTHLSAEALLERFESFKDLAPAGVDCFLFVCRQERFGQEKAEAFAAFAAACGLDALQRTALLFTCLGEKANATLLEEMSQGCSNSALPPQLVACLSKIGHRVVGVDNIQRRSEACEDVHDMVLRVRASCPGPYLAGSFKEAKRWREEMQGSVCKLTNSVHRQHVGEKLVSLLSGGCSREDVEKGLQACLEAEELARVEVLEKHSFGQHEDLDNRIRHILHDYDAARGVEVVCREFVQNADDQGARCLHILLDNRSGAVTEGLFHPDMVWAQGPALVFAMDSVCSEQDLERIQQLGKSGKRLRFDQIGRFGLGMNTMYVFTDQPVLRARTGEGGDCVCYFDPLRKFAAKGLQKPGVRWTAEELGREFPGQLEALRLPASLPGETVFRLPLRGHTTYEPLYDQWRSTDIHSQLRDLVSVLPSWMCFLRSIEQVTIGCIGMGGGGGPDEGVSVLTELSAPRAREWVDYLRALPTDWPSYAQQASASGGDDAHVFFTKTVQQSPGTSSFQFMVASRLPAEARDYAIENAAKTSFALAPMVSVAFDTRDLAHACLFSGLPFGGPASAAMTWPAHVDAFFDLQSSRRDVNLQGEWNEFLLSSILPLVHRDLILNMKVLVDRGDVSVDRYLKLFPARLEGPWAHAAAKLYQLLQDLEVLPLLTCGPRAWGAPSACFWLPPRISRLQSFGAAAAPLARTFPLVDAVGEGLAEQLRHHCRLRTVAACTLGDLLRGISDREDAFWEPDTALSVLEFVATVAQQEGADVAGVLRGTRLLCLDKPRRRVVVFRNESTWFEPSLVELLPNLRVAAGELKDIPGFQRFPGRQDLSLAGLLELKLSAFFAEALAAKLKLDGFAARTPELSAWHSALGDFVECRCRAERQQRQHVIERMAATDLPIILTDDAALSGRFADRLVTTRALAAHYPWQPVHVPAPPVLVSAADASRALLPAGAGAKAILQHVLRDWVGMEAARRAVWVEHLRGEAAQKPHLLEELVAALAELPAPSLRALPAFLAAAFFLFDVGDGPSHGSEVRLEAAFLGDVLRRTEGACGKVGAWPLGDAVRALGVLVEEMRREPGVQTASVLRGTRLLCLSSGEVKVFGSEPFCTSSLSIPGISTVRPEMLEIPGFEGLPGLVKASAENVAQLVLPRWARMSQEQRGRWSEQIRTEVAQSRSFMREVLTASGDDARRQIPAFLSRVFFLFDLQGHSYESEVPVEASLVGDVMRRVEDVCASLDLWSLDDALRAMGVMLELMRREPGVKAATVLKGTRLLCLSSGEVKVFGPAPFCRPGLSIPGIGVVRPEMLEVPGFESLPGLVKVSAENVAKLVLPTWIVMDQAQRKSWSEQIRREVDQSQGYMKEVLSASSDDALRHLPAFVARVFFLFDVAHGPGYESEVQLGASFLGNLLRRVGGARTSLVGWSFDDAVRALGVLVKEMHQEHGVSAATVLEKTRLLCFASGEVSVFGSRRFCTPKLSVPGISVVHPQLLEVPGFDDLPGLIKASVETVMQLVLPRWDRMTQEQHESWSEQIRIDAVQKENYLEELLHAIVSRKGAAGVDAGPLQALPAFLARVFFLFDAGVEGSSHESGVRLGSRLLSSLLRRVQEAEALPADWPIDDAVRALGAVVKEMRREPGVQADAVLRGTRLLCLSTGEVKVFGPEPFCAPSLQIPGIGTARPELLEVPGFEDLPGLVRVSVENIARLVLPHWAEMSQEQQESWSEEVRREVVVNRGFTEEVLLAARSLTARSDASRSQVIAFLARVFFLFDVGGRRRCGSAVELGGRSLSLWRVGTVFDWSLAWALLPASIIEQSSACASRKRKRATQQSGGLARRPRLALPDGPGSPPGAERRSEPTVAFAAPLAIEA